MRLWGDGKGGPAPVAPVPQVFRSIVLVLACGVFYAAGEFIFKSATEWRRVMRLLAVVAFFVCVCLLPSVAAAADDKKEVSSEKALELQACGPKEKEINFSASTDKKSHPTPAPAEGKSMVYVIRPTMGGNKVQTKLAVDGEWKGTNRGNNYFFVELEPGEHFFCSRAENHSAIKLTLEPGKTYFLQQHIEVGFIKAQTRLEAITEEKGREKLAKLNLATWEVKK
jgi:hypothetical protein